MCAACSSWARCATFGARAECARCACARDNTRRKHVGSHHRCRSPLRNRGGVAIMVSGGPAQQAICQHHRGRGQKTLQSDRQVPAQYPD
eukprot:3545592-Pyramimonas_sp.AAC.1